MKHELQEIVAVVNNKGGVGKTTTVQSLAAGMVRKNKHLRVLVIDLDPQCNLSSLLGLKPTECTTIFDALSKRTGLTVYKCYNGVYAVCGSAKMQDIDDFLKQGTSISEVMASYCVLAKCLQDMEINDQTGEGLKSVFDDFDYVFIDCPPAISKSMQNAVVAASSVLVPVQMESLSVRGLKEVLGVMEDVKGTGLNKDVRLAGLLPVMVRSNLRITRELQEVLDNRFHDKVLSSGVPSCVKVLEAQKQNHSIFDDAPYCTASIGYEKAIKELYGI